MITITVPHPTDPSYDEHHGPSQWRETLTGAHYVWEKAGVDLCQFQGRRSGDCAEDVRHLIEVILGDPARFHFVVVNYPTFVTVVANLTYLFFVLREQPDGIVHVT